MIDVLIAGNDSITDDEFENWYVPLIERGIMMNVKFYIENMAHENCGSSLFNKRLLEYFDDNQYYNLYLCGLHNRYKFEKLFEEIKEEKDFNTVDELIKFMVDNTDKDILFIKEGEENTNTAKKLLYRHMIS